MPCEACGMTYQLVNNHNGERTFWCPACGTLKVIQPNLFATIETPKRFVTNLLTLAEKESKPDRVSFLAAEGGKRESYEDPNAEIKPGTLF